MNTPYSVIEIMKPISFMDVNNYIQTVPSKDLKYKRIYIKRGAAGCLTISPKNVRVLKEFENEQKANEYIKSINDNNLKENVKRFCLLIGCSGVNVDCPGNISCDIVQKILKKC